MVWVGSCRREGRAGGVGGNAVTLRRLAYLEISSCTSVMR